MVTDEELEALRQRRIQEMQAQAQGQGSDPQAEAEAQVRKEQAEAQRQAILRQALTPEARSRLANIAMARPKFARNVEDQIISLAMSGRLGGQIDDETLKQLLSQLSNNKKDISITRR